MESELRIAGHQVAVLRERHPPLGGRGLHTGRRPYLYKVNEKILVKEVHGGAAQRVQQGQLCSRRWAALLRLSCVAV